MATELKKKEKHPFPLSEFTRPVFRETINIIVAQVKFSNMVSMATLNIFFRS